jgi:GTP-binding protein HflX
MDLVFLRLDLMAVLEVDGHGGARRLLTAHLLPENVNGKGWLLLDPIPAHDPELDFLQLVQSLEDEFARKQALLEVGGNQDRAILVSVTSSPKTEAEASMEELTELARSSGIAVAERIIQRQQRINPKYLMGRGKLSELVLQALQSGVDLLIFDHDLNPSQMRSITDFTELRIIDRTQLILDIFAQRAKSRPGRQDTGGDGTVAVPAAAIGGQRRCFVAAHRWHRQSVGGRVRPSWKSTDVGFEIA